MSEDQDPESKTEEPTDKKLSEAREKGQVVKSQEVPHLVMVGMSLALMMMMLPWGMAKIAAAIHPFLERAEQMPGDAASVGRMLLAVMVDVGIVLAIPLLLFMVAGVAATVLQIGFMVNAEQGLKFDFGKLNIIKALGQKFSKRNLVEFLKSVAKLVIVTVVVFILLRPLWGSVEYLIALPLETSIAKTIDYAEKILFGVLIVIAFLAAADYLYQRYEFMQRMRMTKQDIKEEFKQSEGDPMIKGRIRQLRMQRARSRMMSNVPTADVVVTNPTHFAVALGYDPQKSAAPVVLAKGADLIAAKIREIAEANGVPLVSNPPLARALYATADIDDEIPTEHYQAVAQIISYVYKLKRKALPG